MRKFNLSLDDMSPHPRAGLGFESIKWCNKLMDEHPGLKVNLFVPAAYCRLGEQPSYLSQHPHWVLGVNKLRANYRIGCHGVFHRRVDGKHPDSNNDEFQFLNSKEALRLIIAMQSEFRKAQLGYHRTFRPPGWKISRSAAQELVNVGYLIAGNEEYRKLTGSSEENWVSCNWDLTGPCNVAGDIVAYGHTSDWTNNYMNEERYNLIKELLGKESFDFRFIEEMV